MRDTSYAEELATATYEFPDGSEGRIERLRFKETEQEGIRFSWWKDNRLMPRPLDATEDELLALLENALEKDVFSKSFLAKLREKLQVSIT
jgi:hypothetical protein